MISEQLFQDLMTMIESLDATIDGLNTKIAARESIAMDVMAIQSSTQETEYHGRESFDRLKAELLKQYDMLIRYITQDNHSLREQLGTYTKHRERLAAIIGIPNGSIEQFLDPSSTSTNESDQSPCP